MHDPNGIVIARSASPLAPDSMAVISDEGLWSLASSPSHCNYKYTLSQCGPMFLYLTIMGAKLGQKILSLKTAFLMTLAELRNIHWNLIQLSFFCIVLPAVSKPIIKSNSSDGGLQSKNSRCSTLQHTATHCNARLHTGTHSYTRYKIQHPTTHGNTGSGTRQHTTA